MEKIPPKYFLYLALAVVAGLIFAFGLASMMHQPLPVQVPLTQYQPAAPPAPAVPTIAPAVTATGNPFAPAPPPVIVTTAPLPTITPIPATPTKAPILKCSVDQNSPANATECMTYEIADMMTSMISVMLYLFPLSIVMSVLASLLLHRGGGGYE